MALRRDRPAASREATLLADLVARGETVCLTGAVLQEVAPLLTADPDFARIARPLPLKLA